MGATKVCKCCQEEKPLTEFYRSGTNYMGRCKQCISDNSYVDRWIAKALDNDTYADMYEDPTKWPWRVIEVVQRFTSYYLHGGRVVYGTSQIMDLIERYMVAHPDEFDTEVQQLSAPATLSTYEAINTSVLAAKALQDKKATVLASSQDVADIAVVLGEAMDVCTKLANGVLGLMNEIKAARLIKDASEKPQRELKESYNTSFNPSPTEMQERFNLVKRIITDLMDNTGLDVVDIQDLREYFDKLFKSMKVQKYVDPLLLRSIPLTYAANNLPMSTDMLILYHKFIEPGIIETRKRSDYLQLAEQVAAIDGVNYYEYDWELIGNEDSWD